MILRRIYVKGRRYGWYFHPEIKTYHDMMMFQEANPQVDVNTFDNATYFFDELSHEEQDNYWRQSHNLVMNHTRWVLDHLDNLCEFKTRWNHYGKQTGKAGLHRSGIGKPPEFTVTSSGKEEPL